ncbi:MAG: ABC transporter ATP-binding protein [Desulfurococcaceae archaeon]
MIEVSRLRVVYKPPGIEALREVTVEVPSGTVTCILGPNASGKTTLLKAIAALVDYEGSVLVGGLEAREAAKQLRKVLSYAQSLDASADYLGTRVVQVLLTSRYPVSSGFADTRRDLEEVLEVAEVLGISHLLERRLGELSSGELQKVVLAAALVKKPKYLLLDEPDSHLDAAYKSWLAGFLKKLAREGKTVVATTHDVLFASAACDNVVVLSRGSVVCSGSAGEVFGEGRACLEKAFGVGFSTAVVGGRLVAIPVYSSEAATNREPSPAAPRTSQ